MALKIGVLALQGAFAKHADVLSRLGVDFRFVKKPDDLNDLDALIIPGGESTTMLRQIGFIQLLPALKDFSQHRPLFGTCAGLILMSREIVAHPEMPSLQLLNVAVERNAFGRQIESFGTDIEVNLPSEKSFVFPAVFIRAPQIVQNGSEVSVLAAYKGKPVLVQQGLHLGASFHPELTEDLRIHRYFLSLVEKNKAQSRS